MGDEDSVERAAKLKAKKNLEMDPKGNCPNDISFLSFDELDMVSKISNLGISVGSSHLEKLAWVDKTKSIELSRLSESSASSNNNNFSLLCDNNVEEGDGIDLLALNHICGEMVEGPSDENCMDLDDHHANSQWESVRTRKKKKTKKNRCSHIV